MTTYLLVGLKNLPKVPGVFDATEPHHSVGVFPDMERLLAYVANRGLPAEWPFYVAIERDVRFYVFVSRTLTTEAIPQMGSDLSSQNWRELIIARSAQSAVRSKIRLRLRWQRRRSRCRGWSEYTPGLWTTST